MAVSSSGKSIPQFAGVALVDILANGVAVLIIIIIVSIASRMEQEQHYAEQEEEVAAVMTRKFSTSLVLNRLAASPAARLHDYENSPLDQILDPYTLPIIEMHKNYVREYYSGKIWERQELLQEDNTMDAWLAGLSMEQKLRLRIDLYDVGQFYLTMSIVRKHGLNAGHWHFLPGTLSLAQAPLCPPGVSASDCLNLATQETPLKLPELPLAQGAEPGSGAYDWPPTEQSGGGTEEASHELGPMPGGATLGKAEGPFRGLGASGSDAAGLHPGDSNFPNAQGGTGAGRFGGMGPRRGQGGIGPNAAGIRLRLALPESQQRDPQIPFGLAPSDVNDLAYMLGAIMYLLSQAQEVLDQGGSPAPLLKNLIPNLLQWIENPPPLTDEQWALVHFLAMDYELSAVKNPGTTAEPLRIHSVDLPEEMDARLVLRPNRLLQDARVGHTAREGTDALPAKGRATLNLNAFPGIWRGLQINLEREATLLMPPQPSHAEQVRWRAVAYISPQLDDYIIGFVHAAVGESGALEIQADDNQVRVGGQQILTTYRASVLGAKGWLVILYAGLAVGLLALFLWWRPLLRNAS